MLGQRLVSGVDGGAGALVGKLDCRPVALVGMLLSGLGSLLMTQVSADGSYFGDLFPPLLVFGAAVGTCFVAVTIAALTGISDDDAGLASGINNAAFRTGGALAPPSSRRSRCPSPPALTRKGSPTASPPPSGPASPSPRRA